MNTIVVLVVLSFLVLNLAIYLVVKYHDKHQEQYPMFKNPLANVLKSLRKFLRELCFVLAAAGAILLGMNAVLITGLAGDVTNSMKTSANHKAYEADYQSWKADQAWRAAADRRLAGSKGADKNAVDAFITVTQEKFAWEVANWRADQKEVAFRSLDTYEAMEKDTKAAQDRWTKRIQNLNW
jgi:hypothetical protein